MGVEIFTTSGKYVVSNAAFPTNQWVYVVGRYDGATVNLYINGVVQTDSGSLSGNVRNVVNPLAMGCGTYLPYGDYIDGTLDEVRISNTARSVAWIKASYESERDNFIIFGDLELQPAYGMQVGEDSDSIAHLMKTGKITIETSYGIPVSSSPSTVGTSTVGSGDAFATIHAYQRKTFYANGRFWVWYSSGSNMVFATSTDGSSWSSPTTVRSCTQGRDFGVAFDGTYVHYAYAYDLGSGLFYRRGTPNSDGTITWSAAEVTILSGVSGRYRWCPSVAVDSNGYPWIGYSDDEGTATNYYPYIIKANAVDGSSWPASGTKLSTTDAKTHVVPVPLTNGKLYAIYTEGTNQVRGKLWDGSSWGGQETATQYGTQTTDQGEGMTGAAVASGDDVHLVYLRDTTNQVRYNKRTYGTGWPSTDTLVQNSVTSTSYPAISINTQDNYLYCFWAGSPTANHIYYKKNSGGAWDTNPTDWITESSPALTGNNVLTSFHQSYAGKIGLVYMTATASPYNIRFACLTFFASTVTTSTSETGTQEPFQRKSFYANGRYWFFYYDLYYTSTDGSSWSEASTEASVDAVWFDGTYLHYVNGGAYLYYRRGTPNSDGTITWSAAEQQVSTTYGEVWWPTISVDSNGYAWIGYADGYTTAYPFVIKSGNNDGTWGTTPGGFPYQLSSTSMSVVVPIPLTGGKMLVLYHPNGNPIYSKRWTGAAWGSERATASSEDQFFSAVAQNDDVHLVFNGGVGNNLIYTKYTYTSDAWGTETTVQSLSNWDQYPVLCRNPANNDLYVFWSGAPTANHIYYKKYSGGSWDAGPTDWRNEGTDTLPSNEVLTCFYQSYGNRVGLAYTTKTSSPYNVKFAYLAINGFQVPGMSANDQYDINFTIGGENFCMLFIATGSNSGTLKLFYKATGAGSWSSGDTLPQSNIASGTTYQSGSGNIGFRLTSSSSSADGSIKFIVTKSYLNSLGASGTSITLVLSATFQSGTGNPGSGGATPNDRCPSSGTASWTYTPPKVPEFPFGILVLAIPVVGIYLYMRKRSRMMYVGR